MSMQYGENLYTLTFRVTRHGIHIHQDRRFGADLNRNTFS